jgi:hypothetical protein
MVLWATCIRSQQNTPEMDEQTKAQVKKLHAISDTIKTCPRQAEYPDTGNGTFYDGPPSNVIWDRKPNSSVRAPYMGYIEFFLPREFSASKKYCAKNAELCAQMMLIPSFQYRFEFDLGPDGLELMKLLAKKKEDKEWSDVQPSAAGLANTCWLKAAQTEK